MIRKRIGAPVLRAGLIDVHANPAVQRVLLSRACMLPVGHLGLNAPALSPNSAGAPLPHKYFKHHQHPPFFAAPVMARPYRQLSEHLERQGFTVNQPLLYLAPND